jgi:uncharacterized YccA/Bax inhibitor family protein
MTSRSSTFRSGNPTLGRDTFAGLAPTAEAMTIQGTVNKSFLLLLLLLISATWVWNQVDALEPAQLAQSVGRIVPWMIGGAIGGMIVALVTVFKKSWSMVTAPLYALLEGLVLGGLSAILEAQYSGIVIQAVALTFGVFFCLLLVYTSRLIKVTQNFRLGIAAATGGIFLVYLASFVLGFFGINIPLIHESGLIGIGFSLFVVIIAALNLVLDFDFIENGAAQGAPKYMEWYGAFGLLVTLVWLYIEILRLLAKLRSRD